MILTALIFRPAVYSEISKYVALPAKNVSHRVLRLFTSCSMRFSASSALMVELMWRSGQALDIVLLM